MKSLKWTEGGSSGEWWYVKAGNSDTPDAPDGINIISTTWNGVRAEFRLSEDELRDMLAYLLAGRYENLSDTLL